MTRASLATKLTSAGNVKASSGSILIRGQEVSTVTRDVDHRQLRFYVDNPRIYSLVRTNGHVPDQDEILRRMLELEHVKVLKEDIVANGGLMDPLIVRDGDFVVLEGNSRLAAYKFLASKEPLRWSSVRCTILPADIEETLVFGLLGQYHLKGKKDWAPYEKAGFLHRRHKDHGADLSTVAKELGIGPKEAKHLVRVYEFMMKHDSDRERWSYYDEYLKSRKIERAREEHANLDGFVVGQIKSKAIARAMDLRDRLPVICAAPAQLKRYVSGKTDFSDAYEAAVDAGGENHALRKLKRFRDWLVLSDTAEDLLDTPKPIRDGMLFELKEIEKRARQLKAQLEKKSSLS